MSTDLKCRLLLTEIERDTLQRDLDEAVEALRECSGGGTVEQYKAQMVNAPCHNGICAIEECARCAREIRARAILAKHGESS